MRQSELTRRGLVRAFGAGAAAGALSRGNIREARATDGNWRRYRHDAQNTGDATGHDAPTAGFEEDWRLENDGIGRPPAVVDDTLYICDNTGVHAINTDDGSRIWSEPIGRVFHSASVVEGAVFVGNVRV